MNLISARGALAIFLTAMPLTAHRLDEYLQASLISLQHDRVEIQLDLTPGIAVFPVVLASIDTDSDGSMSEAEQNAYAARVLRDVSLTVDGRPTPLRLVSSRFPEIGEMKEGVGVIRLDISAGLRPTEDGSAHWLRFENHHQSAIAVYLANSLVPQDPALRITTQSRDFRQSIYRVDYTRGDAAGGFPFSIGTRTAVWSGIAVLSLLATLANRKRQRS
jgi:hypothetical protein